MSAIKHTREDCILLLQNKQKELLENGLTRFPQRSDFLDNEVIAIKAFLGPWPRALEAAGLKEPRNEEEILQKKREKHIRAKRRRRLEKKAAAAEQNINTKETGD